MRYALLHAPPTNNISFSLRLFVAFLLTGLALCGCGENVQHPARTRAQQSVINKREMAERIQKYQASVSFVAAQKAAKKTEAARTAKANRIDTGYDKAEQKFSEGLARLPDVGATQEFGGDGIRVYLRERLPDDQAKFVANGMYRRFLTMRSRYMAQEKARDCTIFLKDENGETLYNAAYYTQ